MELLTRAAEIVVIAVDGNEQQPSSVAAGRQSKGITTSSNCECALSFVAISSSNGMVPFQLLSLTSRGISIRSCFERTDDKFIVAIEYRLMHNYQKAPCSNIRVLVSDEMNGADEKFSLQTSIDLIEKRFAKSPHRRDVGQVTHDKLIQLEIMNQ